MNEPMTPPERHEDRERKSRRGRKLRDLALLLPCAGVVLFATPVLDMFAAANSDIGQKCNRTSNLGFRSDVPHDEAMSAS